jgi:energy-coupling factor transport system permease protein
MNSYLQKETYLHALDVRTKLIIFLLVLFPLFMFNDPLYHAVLLGVLFLAIIPAGLPMKQIFKSIKPLIFVFLIIIVLTCFTANTEKFLHEENKSVLLRLSQNITATVGGTKTG